MSAFASCGRAVAHVRGGSGPTPEVDALFRSPRRRARAARAGRRESKGMIACARAPCLTPQALMHPRGVPLTTSRLARGRGTTHVYCARTRMLRVTTFCMPIGSVPSSASLDCSSFESTSTLACPTRIWLVLFPVGLGLIGFIEPCSIGASLLFLKSVERNPPGMKIDASHRVHAHTCTLHR